MAGFGRRSFLKLMGKCAAVLSAGISGQTWAQPGQMRESDTKKNYKRIAVEEHFTTKAYSEYLYTRKGLFPRRELIEDGGRRMIQDWMTPDMSAMVGGNGGDLADVENRLKEMDEAGIEMQVLSMGYPSIEDFEPQEAITWAKMINDDLADFIKRYPDRFVGLAKIPWQAPAAAVQELERAMKELDMRGVKVDSHLKDGYLDDQKYWPIFEAAERLGAPIYLHPREPHPDIIKPYLNYTAFAMAFWGYPADAGLCAARLMKSGVFEEYPGLKILLGHGGENLPYCIWRMDKKGGGGKISKYFNENFLVTTSGLFSDQALLCAMHQVGADNVLFAVDFPFESSVEGTKWMDAAPISENDKEKIYHLNAKRIFNI